MTVLPVVNMQLSVYCCVSDKNVHGMRHGGEGIHNHLHIHEKRFSQVYVKQRTLSCFLCVRKAQSEGDCCCIPFILTAQ